LRNLKSRSPLLSDTKLVLLPTFLLCLWVGKLHNAAELMQIFESDKHLSRYLHITRNSDVYPIIYDTEDHVLSMPSMINSTAMDDTKLQTVVNMVATMFSEYCAEPFTYVTFV
jgi:phenylalanyl-tRNA synthetase beta subunit